MAEHLLSPSEVAEQLQIPVATVYAWRHRGEGPKGFRVGRHVRYHQADVDAFVLDLEEKDARRRVAH